MKTKGIWHLTGTVAALTLASGANAAAIVDLQVEGGGTQQVYQLSNGNYLGLWGFDARNIASDVNITGAADITGGFASGGDTIKEYYNGPNPVNDGAHEFDKLSYDFTVGKGERWFDSLWVEWSGGNLVYQFGDGTRTMSTMPSTPTLESRLWADGGGNGVSVSEPGSLALLVAGFAGLGLLHRRRKDSGESPIAAPA
ncbi:PEP-CTERM sorting domain-containing protein [Thiohalomonas denitrificans]|uniref:PEP-CTERM protein-sorting domain-containing protein n=1 Tax=Thiohalomonas denitrificans TaxID=415747 RepID=A0A1G5QWN7_9GAMM|nr:PEP-CTERM sorting domain-containing protein [Thiohalomonas denitrificans]SCZ66263.1 PEP-CTERM protein-sorting domain-containing protein [Thiohalomonas denitrificans]